MFDAARILVNKGTAEARAAASQILDQLPMAAHEFSEFWVLTGDICQKRGAFAAAIDAFNKAVAIDGEDSAIWYRIGLNYEVLHLNEESLMAYRKGKEVNPKDDDCWRGLGGRIRMASGKLNQLQRRKLLLESKAAFLEAVKLKPNNSKNQAGLGDVLGDLGDKEGAIGAYKAATDSEPNDWLLWFSFGDLLQQLGRHNEAVKAFEKALKLAKDPIDRELIDEELRTSRRLAR